VRAPEATPSTRTCIVTRQALPVDGLIRFVAGPDGQVVPDLRRRLPGRGVWVTGAAEAVREAVRRNAFSRSLKAPVSASEDLVDQVGALLRRAALQALSLANKAGVVITGSAKIEAAAPRGFAALLHASEAAPGGIEKLERAVRRQRRDGLAIPAIRLFTTEELSLSLGREHVIHAALVTGAPSGMFLKSARAADRYWRSCSATAHASGSPAGGSVDTRISTEDSEPNE